MHVWTVLLNVFARGLFLMRQQIVKGVQTAAAAALPPGAMAPGLLATPSRGPTYATAPVHGGMAFQGRPAAAAGTDGLVSVDALLRRLQVRAWNFF